MLHAPQCKNEELEKLTGHHESEKFQRSSRLNGNRRFKVIFFQHLARNSKIS